MGIGASRRIHGGSAVRGDEGGGCAKNGCCCTEPLRWFTIHGLWPDYDDGTWPSCCRHTEFEMDKILPLKETLDKYWPSLHGEGFARAQVVRLSFGSPVAGELVCEGLEGTRVEYQFLDKLGNVVDGNTKIPVTERELSQ